MTDWSELTLKAGKALAAMNRHAALHQWAQAKAQAEVAAWACLALEDWYEQRLSGTVVKIGAEEGA